MNFLHRQALNNPVRQDLPLTQQRCQELQGLLGALGAQDAQSPDGFGPHGGERDKIMK